jgi:hypothetical protein
MWRHLAHKAQQEHKALPEPEVKALQEHKAQQALVLKALPEPEVKALQEHKVLLEHREQLALKELLEHRAQ